MSESQNTKFVKEEPRDDPSLDEKVTTLTKVSLSDVKPMKRKTSESGDDTGASDVKEEASDSTPVKKQRTTKDKTLLEVLGLSSNAKHYQPSRMFTGTQETRATFTRQDLAILEDAMFAIKKCILPPNDTTPRRLSELRLKIHDLEVSDTFNNKSLIETSKILEDQGLRLLFEIDVAHIPFDIRVDAQALFGKWSRGEFDSSLLRGIAIEKKHGRGIHYKLDDAYQSDRISANAVGHNGLVNGQWWPIRICAFRDGAHGEIEAGIHGKAGVGAYSIVMSSGGYADKDLGEVIHYCGTTSKTPTPTSRTSFLRSTINKHPIRVLRGVSKKSEYAPPEGYRYDGLYMIVSEELLDEGTAMYRFKMERVAGQDPIRYKGVEKRPTKREMEEKKRVWASLTG